MNEEKKDGLFDNIGSSTLWSVIIVALGLGGGSGLYTAASTQDRFTSSQFAAEIRSRDVEIGFLKQIISDERSQLRALIAELKRHQREDHPPESIKEVLADHERRLRANNQ